MSVNPITAIVVDDEPLAVEGVRRVCDKTGRITLLGEANDGPTALELIERVRPQVVFLDIAMPGMSGLEVAAALRGGGTTPLVILVTANDHYATEAFDLSVVDYVLKPVDADRLIRAIDRAVVLLDRQPVDSEGREALWVPYRGTVMRLPISAIRRLDAERDYVRVSDAERSYLMRATLADIADRLSPAGFIRVHRSTILARAGIQGLRHVGGGAWVAVDSAGQQTPIGRTYLADVRAALGLAGSSG